MPVCMAFPAPVVLQDAHGRSAIHTVENAGDPLLRLVKRIEVGEKYEIAGETHRDIKIYYNFVGYVEL
mgnify:CR=1 FL=1